MKVKYLIASIKPVFNSVIFDRNAPLAISYNITDRCNYNCQYCFRWQKNGTELSTDEIMDFLLKLKNMGTVFLQITGGEPFLHPDLLDIVKKCKELGFFTGINTNGSLIGRNEDVLKFIDKITFSLDGPPNIHQKVRPDGSFDKVVSAIAVAKRYNLDVGVNTTLTKYNLESIDYLVDFASEHNVKISFQPCFIHKLSSSCDSNLTADNKHLLKAFNRIEQLKKKNKHIANSYLDLKAMKLWPNNQNMDCAGGKLFYRVESNGDVLACGAKEDFNSQFPNILKDGVRQAFEKVTPLDCKNCFNITRLKINLAYNFMKCNRKMLASFHRRRF